MLYGRALWETRGKDESPVHRQLGMYRMLLRMSSEYKSNKQWVKLSSYML